MNNHPGFVAMSVLQLGLALSVCFFLHTPTFGQNDQNSAFRENQSYKVTMLPSYVNENTTHVVSDERLASKQGASLAEHVDQALNGEREEADILFTVNAPKAGKYLIQTYAVTDDEGAKLMEKAKTKFESLFLRLQIGNSRPTKRVAYVPWNRPSQRTGVFELSEGEQKIKIWLPRGVILESVQFRSYVPPVVPQQAINYRPSVLPPPEHPRLWVNKHSLTEVRTNLTKGENKSIWEKLKTDALAPFDFRVDPDTEVEFNAELETAAEKKALYYLITGDKRIGYQAITLMKDYISHVEFGNLLDITREMGRAIHVASEVYDWCYDLLTAEEKKVFVEHLMRLANDMEIGWPPFRMKILNGHGNEAMVNRDLLSMSIAIYDENPTPYRYVSYAILEELVPMRKFEYQSPRHNQGVQYGAYRFAWEMHSALMFLRMNNTEIFDENIKDLYKYWLYMKTPGGQMLRDGDGFAANQADQFYTWRAPLTMFLMYAYSKNPLIKGEFIRQNETNSINPVLFLLLNDPSIEPSYDIESLPLTMDFGGVLGSMVARTGWNISPESDDVVVEIKGGGYHFGNHQHADAGSVQLYYRGFQLGDMGLYRFYGTPYDMGFNKRSVSHSMMLVVDPQEKFIRSDVNDGGTRLNQRAPISPQQVKDDAWFHNGKILSVDVGPSKQHPLYSYFAVDLTSAYSAKVEKYTRRMCFVNTGESDIPAFFVLSDDITSASEDYEKIWQINTFNIPKLSDQGEMVLHNSFEGRTGNVHVQMLRPTVQERHLSVLKDTGAYLISGTYLEPPASDQAERNGVRVLVSPKHKQKHDRFLTVFQVAEANEIPHDVVCDTNEVGDVVQIGNYLVNINKSTDLISRNFTVNVKRGGPTKVIVAGLKSGVWQILTGEENGKSSEIKVKGGNNTIYFESDRAGIYKIRLVSEP